MGLIKKNPKNLGIIHKVCPNSSLFTNLSLPLPLPPPLFLANYIFHLQMEIEIKFCRFNLLMTITCTKRFCETEVFLNKYLAEFFLLVRTLNQYIFLKNGEIHLGK